MQLTNFQCQDNNGKIYLKIISFNLNGTDLCDGVKLF